MSIRRVFTEPWWSPKRATDRMLAIGLFALVACILLYVIRSSGSRDDPYAMGVLGLMLLFSGLAGLAHECQFRWPAWLVAAFKLLSLAWTVFGLFYLLYLSRVLFPINRPPGN
jgi:hypothetical protein